MDLARLLWAALHLLGAPSLFEEARRPLARAVMPAGMAPSARACAGCHADRYAEWAASRHASAFTNPTFVASFRREPMRWCRNCHAPLPAQAARDAPLAGEGVNCAACHVRDGQVLTARPPTDAARAAHPMRVEPALAGADFCGGCHQFNFPGDRPPFHYTAAPMQDTLAEWRASAAARRGRACQACHMPGGAHRFPGGRDRALLDGSFALTVERAGPGRVRARLAAAGAGHRVPTGDPFRRLVLELCGDDACDPPLARARFARGFRKAPDGWALAADTAVPPGGAREVSLAADGARWWRLTYLYAAPGTEADLADDERQLELRRGALP